MKLKLYEIILICLLGIANFINFFILMGGYPGLLDQLGISKFEGDIKLDADDCEVCINGEFIGCYLAGGGWFKLPKTEVNGCLEREDWDNLKSELLCADYEVFSQIDDYFDNLSNCTPKS